MTTQTETRVTHQCPTLNQEFLAQLIEWAEARDSMDQLLRAKYADWGGWDQGWWAKVLNIDPATGNSNDDNPLYDADDDDDIYRLIEQDVCGTAYCMAGQTVVQHGYRLHFVNLSPSWDVAVNPVTGETEEMLQIEASHCVPQEPTGRIINGRPEMEDAGEQEAIEEVAERILGLCHGSIHGATERQLLFAAHNTVGDLKLFANEFCERRGLPLMYDPETYMCDPATLVTEDV